MKRPTGKVTNRKELRPKTEPEVIHFASASDFRFWLGSNFHREEGIWLRFSKKGSGTCSVTYAEALDQALCFGWIDGQVKRVDDKSYLQRFTQRRPRSIWSERNIEHVERLIAAGLMQEPGFKQITAAKADGRWERAYDPPSAIQPPPEFLAKLVVNQKALRFFKQLNKTNRYAICWRLHTAKKPETRAQRIDAIIAMLAAGKKFH